MALYVATVGFLEDGKFEGEGASERFDALSDQKAEDLMWLWVANLSGWTSSATHVRLREDLGSFKRRTVGTWSIVDHAEAKA